VFSFCQKLGLVAVNGSQVNRANVLKYDCSTSNGLEMFASALLQHLQLLDVATDVNQEQMEQWLRHDECPPLPGRGLSATQPYNAAQCNSAYSPTKPSTSPPPHSAVHDATFVVTNGEGLQQDDPESSFEHFDDDYSLGDADDPYNTRRVHDTLDAVDALEAGHPTTYGLDTDLVLDEHGEQFNMIEVINQDVRNALDVLSENLRMTIVNGLYMRPIEALGNKYWLTATVAYQTVSREALFRALDELYGTRDQENALIVESCSDLRSTPEVCLTCFTFCCKGVLTVDAIQDKQYFQMTFQKELVNDRFILYTPVHFERVNKSDASDSHNRSDSSRSSRGTSPDPYANDGSADQRTTKRKGGRRRDPVRASTSTSLVGASGTHDSLAASS